MAKEVLEVPSVIVFSDVNPDVLISSPYELVFNEESVKKSLETIFTTSYASRPFRRRFGTKIMDLLYEPVDSTTAARLEALIRDTVNMWEPRLSNLKVLVIPDPPNQQYYVETSYSIPALGDKMVSYKFNISR